MLVRESSLDPGGRRHRRSARASLPAIPRQGEADANVLVARPRPAAGRGSGRWPRRTCHRGSRRTRRCSPRASPSEPRDRAVPGLGSGGKRSDHVLGEAPPLSFVRTVSAPRASGGPSPRESWCRELPGKGTSTWATAACPSATSVAGSAWPPAGASSCCRLGRAYEGHSRPLPCRRDGGQRRPGAPTVTPSARDRGRFADEHLIAPRWGSARFRSGRFRSDAPVIDSRTRQASRARWRILRSARWSARRGACTRSRSRLGGVRPVVVPAAPDGDEIHGESWPRPGGTFSPMTPGSFVDSPRGSSRRI